MINRRSFLHVTVGAAAVAALGPYGYCAAPKRDLLAQRMDRIFAL
jgi:hypothetical protein